MRECYALRTGHGWGRVLGSEVAMEQGACDHSKASSGRGSEGPPRISSIFNYSSDLFSAIDFEGRFVEVNSAWTETLGWTGEELCGKLFLDFVHPEDREATAREAERLIRERDMKDHFVNRYTTRFGGYRWIQWNTTVLSSHKLFLSVARDVTVEKERELFRKRREELWRSLMEQAPVGIFHSDEDGHCVYSNPCVNKMAGRTFSQMFDSGWIEAIHSDDRPFVFEEWTKSVEKGVPFNGEYRIVTPEGKATWVLGRAVRLSDPDGNPCGFLGIVQEIDRIKRAEECLKNKSEELEALLNHSPDMVVRFDSQLRMSFVNAAAAEGCGIPRENLLGKKLSEVSRSPRLTNLFEQRLCLAMKERAENRFEFRARNGADERYYEARLQPEADPDTGEIKSVLMFTRDMTERRHAEESTRLTAELLQEAQDIAQLGHWKWEVASGKVQANPIAIRIFGQPEDKVTIHFREFEEALHPDDRAATVAFLRAKLHSNENSYRTEYRIRTRDGQVKDIVAIGHIYRNKEGLAVHVTGTVQDITQTKQIHRELALLTEKLKRSNEDLEQYAYLVSHDLQEPVRMVQSYLHLLERRLGNSLDAESKEYFDFAADGARRMSTLIRSVLNYSRMSIGQSEKTVFNVSRVFAQVVTTLNARIAEVKGVVTCDPLPEITADSTRLAQIFQNLIENSLKYRSERPPQIHVSVELREKAWCFCVKDNGMGITPGEQQKIFAPFHRSAPDGVSRGSGLGLAICKKAVESQGGQLWVESKQNEGSKFYFTIPF